LPERRTISLIRFSAKAVAPTMTVDPKAVEQQFEARKAQYAKPELRSLVEIPLNDASKAAQVQAALTKGDDPQAVAKSVGVEAIPYADQPESAIADRKAAAAAFAMKQGQVSGPVQGDFKTVILQVTKITPGQAPDLAAARAEIETQLKESEAIEKVYDLSQKFEDLRQGGASSKDAAAKLGLTVQTVGPVTAEGKDILGAPTTPPLTQKVLTTAFQTAAGGDSDVEQDADKGEYYAVHVDEIIPAGPPRLTDAGIKPLVAGAYISQMVGQALQAKATAAQAALQKGQTFEQAAGANGGHVTHQLGLQQAAAQPFLQTLGRSFLVAISQAKQGQVFILHSQELKGAVVARVDHVTPPDPRQVSSVVEMIRERAGPNYANGLQEALQAAALKLVNPSTDLDLARQAMGVDADMVARATGKSAGK
jgi:peptidyl-prolyl cis-trans isomerase D